VNCSGGAAGASSSRPARAAPTCARRLEGEPAPGRRPSGSTWWACSRNRSRSRRRDPRRRRVVAARGDGACMRARCAARLRLRALPIRDPRRARGAFRAPAR
jgi:hypothetical protein